MARVWEMEFDCKFCGKKCKGGGGFKHVSTCEKNPDREANMAKSKAKREAKRSMGVDKNNTEVGPSEPKMSLAMVGAVAEGDVPVKRGRGRPRKSPVPVVEPPTPSLPGMDPQPGETPAEPTPAVPTPATPVPVKRGRGRPRKNPLPAEGSTLPKASKPTGDVGAQDQIVEDIRNIVADNKISMAKNGAILIPGNLEDGESICTEWIKGGDKRRIRQLKEGSESGLRYDIRLGKNKRQFFGLVRIGKTNEKTGAMTVYSWEHRSPVVNKEGEPIEKEMPFIDSYGSVRYWSPVDINGEDVEKLQSAMGIGA